VRKRHRLTIVLTTVIALLSAFPQPAAACSAGPSFDPREYAPLLVLGRVRSVDIGGASLGDFRQAVVTLDLVHVYRGTAISPLQFVDSTSALVERDAVGREVIRFAGGSGACGTIDSDPVGKSVLIALARGDDALWHANRLYGAFYGEALELPVYRWMLERFGVSVPFLVADPVHEALERPALA
jgi:hypothetical protein